MREERDGEQKGRKGSQKLRKEEKGDNGTDKIIRMGGNWGNAERVKSEDKVEVEAVDVDRGNRMGGNDRLMGD